MEPGLGDERKGLLCIHKSSKNLEVDWEILDVLFFKSSKNLLRMCDVT